MKAIVHPVVLVTKREGSCRRFGGVFLRETKRRKCKSRPRTAEILHIYTNSIYKVCLSNYSLIFPETSDTSLQELQSSAANYAFVTLSDIQGPLSTQG